MTRLDNDGPLFSSTDHDAPAEGRAVRRRRSWPRRHKALSAFAGLLVLLLVVVGGAALYLNHQLGSIPRITIDPPAAGRPAAPSNDSMNILLAGVDNGDNGDSIAEEVASGKWKPGSHRSDTLIVLHLTADRKHAYLVSIPRDSYVPVQGYGKQKINAAFSYGGPSLAVQTVEQFTGLRMEHVALIDWNGFRDLSTALGGVRVYVPETTRTSKGTVWQKGYTTLEGDRALKYVRTRYGLKNGDYDRIQRQQNFLRAALDQAGAKGNLTKPLRFRDLLRAVTTNLTVDSQFTNSQIRGLAWSLRGLRSDDITFITAPKKRFASNDAGSVIIPDVDRTKELFGAVTADELDTYVAKYGDGAQTLNSKTGVR
ncbi:transcriptional regulator [Marmoricola endophyticus]|uniref:Transcriptional regulator n=1 Tax=Marmoricola endophyticus TaxID=2040280 RepID=A0A917F4Z7_9ACTN|nr:LCP family protein [Marmoricola endophyticus]GGF43782.1 transcriptional regulator [Marmoricola endophyticus]